MSGKVNKRDAIKTAFSASASGFFSAANNEVNNVKKLDQSVSLYEKLERRIRTSDGKSLSLSDCVIKLALNEPSVTLRDRVMVSLCAEAMSIIPECGLENASLVISRSKRAGFFGRYFFFFWSFRERKGRQEGGGGGGSQRQKFRHKRGKKPFFF